MLCGASGYVIKLSVLWSSHGASPSSSTAAAQHDGKHLTSVLPHSRCRSNYTTTTSTGRVAAQAVWELYCHSVGVQYQRADVGCHGGGRITSNLPAPSAYMFTSLSA